MTILKKPTPFGKAIYDARVRMALSQDQACKMFGCSYSYLSRLENGVKTMPSIALLLDLADAYGIHFLDLVELLDPPRRLKVV